MTNVPHKDKPRTQKDLSNHLVNPPLPESASLLERARAISEQLVAWRRDIHQHPELGFQEQRTARRVAEIASGLGCRVQTGVGRTGVVCELGSGERVVGLRADMDALPIQEANQTPYASQNAGVMHACGHDAHTAMLLGVIQLLSRQDLPGRLRFFFQPAEEVADEEGKSGAMRMIEDGAMQDVEAVIALHVDSASAVGDVEVDDGPNSAGVDTFYATILGRGGHGAAPHKVIDPIYIAGHVVLALNGIVSRRLHPTVPAVVSIGSIHGGDASNVIPASVEISGTIRFMDKSVQIKIHQEVERALQIARTLGGDYELKLEIGNPPSYNNPAVSATIRAAAADLLGEDHLKTYPPEMGAEDFAYFCDLAPGSMFTLGARIEGDERRHHSPRFDIDEGCLPVGTAILAESALRLLKK
jgi:amidohydrolase